MPCNNLARIVLTLLLAAATVQAEAVISSTGEYRALVLFAGFSGLQDEDLPPWADDLFEPHTPGSVTHFFATMSDGRLALSGTVAPRRYLSTRRPSDFVAQARGSGLFGQFVTEILAQADQELNFADFDADGDGAVDLLYVVVPQVPAGFISGGATGVDRLGFAGDYQTNDRGSDGAAVRIDPRLGTLQTGRTLPEAVGSIAHETGHLLGLPDLFNTSYVQTDAADPADDSAGIGAWGLMGWGASGWNGDDGPNPFSAWSLLQLGWAQAMDLDQVEQELRLQPLGSGGMVGRLVLGPRESFLLSYRSRQSSHYERNLPGEGLLVWHVSGESDQQLKLDLVCADGLWREAGFPLGVTADPRGGDNLDFWAHDDQYRRAHGGNLGDATDLFDGVRFAEFSHATNPAARRLDGTAGITVDRIHIDAGELLARVRLAPAKLEVRDLSVIDADHDGVLTAGEEGVVQVRFANSGGVRVRNVSMTVTPADPALRMLQSSARFGDVPVGESLSTPVNAGGRPRFVAPDSGEVVLNVRIVAEGSGADTLIERQIVRQVQSRIRVAGRVTEQDGVPVPGVQFLCGAYCSFTTDADGRFEVHLFPGNRGVFSIDGPSHLAQYLGVLRADGTEVHLVMDPLVTVTGRIRLSDGTSAVGVLVETEPLQGGTYRRASTDSDGRFDMSLREGFADFKVTPTAALKAQNYTVQRRSNMRVVVRQPIELELKPGLALELSVQDADGAPVSGGGRSNAFRDHTWLFDSLGRARVVLPARAHQLRLTNPPAATVTVLVDARAAAFRVLRLPAYHSVTGVVHGPFDPMSRTSVWLVSHDGRFSGAAATDRQGNFDLLAPAGTYDVMVGAEDAFDSPPTQAVGTVSVPATHRLQLHVQETTQQCFRLLQADGQAAGNYRVTAWSEAGEARPLAISAADGLVCVDAGAGRHRLSVRGPQGRRYQQLSGSVALAPGLTPEVHLPEPDLREISVEVHDVTLGERVPALVELTDDPRHPTDYWPDIQHAPGASTQGVRLLRDETITVDIARARHVVAMRYELTGLVGTARVLSGSGPVRAVLRGASDRHRIYGLLTGPAASMRHNLVLRLYDEGRGTVVQWTDSYGTQAQQPTYAMDGRQYLLEAPAGSYTVRAGVFIATRGFVAEYDVGRIEVVDDRRWDIDLHDAATTISSTSATPSQPALHPAFPNPFNQRVVLAFDTAVTGVTELAVYNLLGQRVRSLLSRPMQPGQHRAVWDGRNENGQPLGTGVYFGVLRTDGFRMTTKLLLLR